VSAALSPEQRERLEALFDRAADLPRAEHAAFVERECPAQDALRRELVRLLAGLAGEDLLDQLQPESLSRVGTHIGPYELVERVGEGGMGEVYAARQEQPVARRVALKIIKPGMDTAQVVARFETERQALARMAHPHIAQILDGGSTGDGRPYFVMEFVEGEPITAYCDRLKLSTRERLELFLGVCEGVQHAHQKGVIHRDLKPSNVLVTQRDGVAVPKIIDFGVARATTGRLAERTLYTMPGQIVGTLDYMSPEQADPTAQDIDTRSDIYTLGVLLYQLVSGLLPFEHATKAGALLSEVVRTIREHDPQTPSTHLRRKAATATVIAPLHGTDERSLIRQLAGDLDWICLRALEKDPARRYASASELAADVQRHLDDEPVLAGRPGALYRARKFVRRNRLGVTAGALVLVGAVVGVLGIVAGRLEAEDSARLARAETAKVLRLSDGQLVHELMGEADALWPAHPDRIEALRDWLQRAERLVDRLDLHRATLASLQGGPSDEAPEEAGSFTDRETQRDHDRLVDLIGELEAWQTGLLSEDTITSEHGWSMPKRLAFAEELRSAFAPGGVYGRAWAEALPAIRAAYPGWDWTPQMGLVPLGPDEDSGLWVFAHLMSGEPAQRGADGELILTPETGIVLVLLPGGTFKMGAQRADPIAANYVPKAGRFEGPTVEETLAPFFLSKYEMTEGAWQRMTGIPASLSTGGLLPVTGVSALRCDRVMQQAGLALPEERQWEYGARAGTTTIWWTGDELSSLEGAGNLLDQATDGDSEDVEEQQAEAKWTGSPPVPWNDGHFRLAPVGRFAANGFGLHDVVGNAGEWCSTAPYPYWDLDAPRADPAAVRMSRGGHNRAGPNEARSAFRGFNNSSSFTFGSLGLRPARAVER
jgi:serine/threonine protein kinase/formylglycine-generating enzyme required for sulfatase activity